MCRYNEPGLQRVYRTPTLPLSLRKRLNTGFVDHLDVANQYTCKMSVYLVGMQKAALLAGTWGLTRILPFCAIDHAQDYKLSQGEYILTCFAQFHANAFILVSGAVRD